MCVGYNSYETNLKRRRLMLKNKVMSKYKKSIFRRTNSSFSVDKSRTNQRDFDAIYGIRRSICRYLIRFCNQPVYFGSNLKKYIVLRQEVWHFIEIFFIISYTEPIQIFRECKCDGNRPHSINRVSIVPAVQPL